MPGRVVVLNGASSAGKTSLATAFVAQRATAGELWLLTGLDDYIAKLPAEFVDIPGSHGARGAEGLQFVPTDAGIQVEVGPLGARVFGLFRRTVALWATLGCNVIVDEVLLSAENAAEWHTALDGIDTTWVAVRCDGDVNDAREAARDDRHLGLARVQRKTVHTFVSYDCELDSTATPPEELATSLAGQLAARS